MKFTVKGLLSSYCWSFLPRNVRTKVCVLFSQVCYERDLGVDRSSLLINFEPGVVSDVVLGWPTTLILLCLVLDWLHWPLSSLTRVGKLFLLHHLVVKPKWVRLFLFLFLFLVLRVSVDVRVRVSIGVLVGVGVFVSIGVLVVSVTSALIFNPLLSHRFKPGCNSFDFLKPLVSEGYELVVRDRFWVKRLKISLQAFQKNLKIGASGGTCTSSLSRSVPLNVDSIILLLLVVVNLGVALCITLGSVEVSVSSLSSVRGVRVLVLRVFLISSVSVVSSAAAPFLGQEVEIVKELLNWNFFIVLLLFVILFNVDLFLLFNVDLGLLFFFLAIVSPSAIFPFFPVSPVSSVFPLFPVLTRSSTTRMTGTSLVSASGHISAFFVQSCREGFPALLAIELVLTLSLDVAMVTLTTSTSLSSPGNLAQTGTLTKIV